MTFPLVINKLDNYYHTHQHLLEAELESHAFYNDTLQLFEIVKCEWPQDTIPLLSLCVQNTISRDDISKNSEPWI